MAGHGGEVADAAVGDDGRGAADLGAQGEDVADGAGALFAAGLHHQDLALVDGVDGALLGVEAAAVGLEEVLAVGDVAQGPGQADDRAGPGGWSCRPSMLTLFRPRLRSWEDRVAVADALQLRLQLRGQDGAPAAGAAAQAGRFAGTVGLLPLQVIGLGPGAEVRERRRAFRHPGDQPAGGRAPGEPAGASTSTSTTSPGSATEAPAGVPVRMMSPCFEGEQLGQVGDEPGEREEQVLGGVVLDELAVVPGADPQLGGVDGVGRDQAPGPPG